jgi:diguanylate cyclase (GGDEF)-like protein
MLCVLCLGAVVAQAQPVPVSPKPTGVQSFAADTVFRPVAAASNLPNALVPAVLAEDGSGLLWAGGEGGLVKFDGYRFHAYGTTESPDGLLDHFVLSLHRDARGRLFVGTGSGGLARYDPALDRFVPIGLGAAPGSANSVNAMADDGAAGLWVATGAGVFHLDAAGTVLSHWRHEAARPDSLPDDRIEAVLKDRLGRLWVGGADGLMRSRRPPPRVSPLENSFVVVALPVPAGEPADIRKLMQDSAGRIWVTTRQQGAYVVEPDGSVHGIAATQHPQTDDAGSEIKAMEEVAPGRIWLGSFGRGIVEVDAATLATRRIVRDPALRNSLDHDTVEGLYRDASGLVWVSTTYGLSQADPANAGILTIQGSTGQGSAGRGTRLTTEDAIGVLARPGGALWVGSNSNGIDILDASGQRISNLPVARVWCLASTASGPVFIGARGGLYVADPDGKHVVQQEVPGRRSHNGVYAILPLDGTLWLGGRNDGLWNVQPGPGGQMTVLQHVDVPALNDGAVHAIAAMPDGKLAIGTEAGVNLLDLHSHAVQTVLPYPGEPPVLRAAQVESLLVDAMGRLWVGTDGAGIAIVTGRDARGEAVVRHLAAADGLPNGGINAMLPDRRGRVWVSTDHGLAVIDPGTLAVTSLGPPDGVAITQYWAGSASITADGALVFGGDGGITIVHPDHVARWTYQPPVVITGIRLGGRDLAAGQGGDAPVSIEVPADANSVTVEFAALDYSAPDRNLYRYRLDGFDRDWVQTDAAHRFAAYTNLPPGDYTLRLAGSNRNGVWAPHEATLQFHVLPAWYQTLWFQAIKIGAVLALGAGLLHVRTVLLHRRQRELEKQVAERTAELSASQRQLHQLAYFDALTALPNRRAFNEKFAQMVEAASAGRSFAVVMVDLDGFKKVNDTLGHDAGDALLVLAAGRLRQAVRDGDFVARLGGDEFAILLTGVRDSSGADLVCERIVTLMAEPLSIEGTLARIGASVGAALCPRDARTQDELFKRVDLALYDAKHCGRGIWRWYNESLQQQENAPAR